MRKKLESSSILVEGYLEQAKRQQGQALKDTVEYLQGLLDIVLQHKQTLVVVQIGKSEKELGSRISFVSGKLTFMDTKGIVWDPELSEIDRIGIYYREI